MRRTPGFTVLETTAGLAVAAVTVGIGVVQLTAVLETARLAGAARSLAASMRLTRGQALASGDAFEVRFDQAAATWQVTGGDPASVHRLPPGVVFGTLPARRRIRFGALGTAENGTIVLAAGPRLRRIVVNQRGRVRVQ
jgi:Tfp pilus assembly protein FimT